MMRSPYPTAKHSNIIWVVAVVLAIWLALVFLLGAAGAFVTPPGKLPLPILIGVTVPILAFLSAFCVFRAFRDIVSTVDLSLLTGIQAWRFAGFGFLALYAHGVLPGLFAWPAGLGDVAIGITAPWVTLALLRRPAFAGSQTFMVWNLLGILDLVVAVSAGALSSGLALGVTGEITTGSMARLPLLLVPAYLVPLFIMLHLTALFQARQLRAGGLTVRHQLFHRKQSVDMEVSEY